MTLTAFFLSELESEAPLTRRMLERVPMDRPEWKPHERSMPLGPLAALVATLPSWAVMTIEKDALDLAPVDGPAYAVPAYESAADLAKALDANVEQARQALSGTTDDHLDKPWSLLVGGQVVFTLPRHTVLRSTVFNHLAHHRGQLTVYLRLNGVSVPSIYGPSADER